MFELVLQQSGLTKNEAKVYEALLKLGEATTNQLTIKSKVHRSNVYDALHKLIEKGLASEVFMKTEKRFKATHPRRLLELQKEKEAKIEQAIPSLEQFYKSTEQEEFAAIYKGVEGFKKYMRDILETKETVHTIGGKGWWLDPRVQYTLKKWEREKKKKKTASKVLFDYEVKKEAPEIFKVIGKNYKFLPKKYSANIAIDIFGDYVVTFVGEGFGKLPEEPTLFVMKNKNMAEGYKKIFNMLWEKVAKP